MSRRFCYAKPDTISGARFEGALLNVCPKRYILPGSDVKEGKQRLAYVSLLRSVGTDLFSRAVASQVFSALQSLTSVFGMGTGGPSALKAPTHGGLLLPNHH